jgi:hypothetical protein
MVGGLEVDQETKVRCFFYTLCVFQMDGSWLVLCVVFVYRTYSTH